MPGDTLPAVRAKQQFNEDLIAKAVQLRLVADLVVGACLRNACKNDVHLNEDLVAVADIARRLAAGQSGAQAAGRNLARDWLQTGLRAGSAQRSPLHWPLAFADVFEAGGVSAIRGNPPYLRGPKLTGA